MAFPFIIQVKFRCSFSQSCLFINVISYKCAFNKILHSAKIQHFTDNQRKMNGRNWNPQQYSLNSLFSQKPILMVSFSKPAQECRIRPIGHMQDTENTFSKLLWIPCRLLPDYLSQNGSICGQSHHRSIILSADPIYMVLWTTLHSLSKCLDRTPWKTLWKWVLYMAQCL